METDSVTRLSFYFRDPSILTDFDEDNDAIAWAWLISHNRVNIYDRSDQISTEVMCYYNMGLHHQYSIKRNNHNVAVFQFDANVPEEKTEHVSGCRVAFQYGHNVFGMSIAMKNRCFVCKRNGVPVRR